jgi:CO/xanthine dehydrogenase Mo-binding subunit
VASRTIYIVGNMLRRLGEDIREELGGDVAAWMAAHPSELPRSFEAAFEPDPSVVFDEQTYRGSGYKHYSWAACAALVEIDPDTAETRILDIWAVLDVGKLAHADIAEGQACGGMAQACGWALGEWFFKPGLGRLSGFTDYALPTSMDAPAFNVHFLDMEYPICKGLGELPMDFPAPAIRNAVRHALGAAPDEIPLLPERLLPLLPKDEQ